MYQLEMIRAAAEDLEAARILLNERTEALHHIIRTALEHGVSPAQISEHSGLPASALTTIVAEAPTLAALG